MSYVDTVNEIIRRHPELRSQLEGHTSKAIVAGFARTFSAEEPRRDALGEIRHEGREPTRHPSCRCTSIPCQCAATRYDPPDPQRDAATVAWLRRAGWEMD
jgi:hypothetical protein